MKNENKPGQCEPQGNEVFDVWITTRPNFHKTIKAVRVEAYNEIKAQLKEAQEKIKRLDSSNDG